ncbi:MAG: GlsB/YeaQ/YmgE family stress response membrane protein [Pseudolabrys sp.]
MPSIDHVIVWIVVGLFGGGLAGALMTWERGGFGLWRNLALGLAGAFIGGLLFRIFGIWPGLDKIAISLRDVVAAVIGSLLVLAVLWLWQKFRTSSEKP